jgi:hypothetical protein
VTWSGPFREGRNTLKNLSRIFGQGENAKEDGFLEKKFLGSSSEAAVFGPFLAF